MTEAWSSVTNGDGPMPNVGSCASLVLVVPDDGTLDRVHRACKEHSIDFGFERFGRFFMVNVNDTDGFPVTINERA